MKNQSRIAVLVLYAFIFITLGSCASKRSFHKRQYLSGRNINLSGKFKVQKNTSAQKSNRNFIEHQDSIVNRLPKSEFAEFNTFQVAPSETIEQRSTINDVILPKMNLEPILENKKISSRSSNSETKNSPIKTNSKRVDRIKLRAVFRTSLLYFLGITALVAAVILLVLELPEMIVLLLGGLGLILIYLGWNHWQKYRKEWDPKTTDTEPSQPDNTSENKLSGSSQSTKTLVTVLLTVFGLGALVYFLFFS